MIGKSLITSTTRRGLQHHIRSSSCRPALAATTPTLLSSTSTCTAVAWASPTTSHASKRWYSRTTSNTAGLPSFLSNFVDLEHEIRHQPIHVLSEMTSAQTWTDRLQLQKTWSLSDKGWQVSVEWKETPLGVGVFASHDIRQGALLRVGTTGHNLLQFHSAADIERFCASSDGGGEEYHARLNYVSDYLWGYFPETVVDDAGYPQEQDDGSALVDHPGRFFGMWIPGNGLNHSIRPNTVYKTRPGGVEQGLYLVALKDIRRGEELYDDYQRHGRAPAWLQQFGSDKQIALNFEGCNAFL